MAASCFLTALTPVFRKNMLLQVPHGNLQRARGSGAAPDPTPGLGPWESRSKTHVSGGGPRLANTSPICTLSQPGIAQRMTPICYMGKAPCCGCPWAEPQPHCGEMAGLGSGQAELQGALVDTGPTAEGLLESSTMAQEGLPDPTHQVPVLQPRPWVQDPAQEHCVHKHSSTHHCKAEM